MFLSDSSPTPFRKAMMMMKSRWGRGGLLFMCLHHSKVGWTGGGGSFSEESPSDISEVSSVSEDDNVDLAVEHGGDGEGLPVTGLQEQTQT